MFMLTTRAKADYQRKHDKFQKIPGGESVEYNPEAPDLRLDLANIEGRCVYLSTLGSVLVVVVVVEGCLVLVPPDKVMG